MSSDIKTIADAQPGGRVRLADQALSTTELRRNAHVLVLQELRARFTDACCPSRTAALDAAIAALSSHPSPGGQDALDCIGRIEEAIEFRVPHDIYAAVHGELAELKAALAGRQPVGQTFQAGVAEWMGQCFLPSLYSNMTERGDRLLEEVLELLQAHGYDKARVPTLVDYVFGRPVGEPAQEVGGVMVTLAGYCWVAGLDMHVAGDAELTRINQPEVMAKIRAKQEAKNALHFDTPLPGNAARQPVGEPVGTVSYYSPMTFGGFMIQFTAPTPIEPGTKLYTAPAQAVGLGPVHAALQAAARSLRTIADSTKDTEFLETAHEIRAYANSRANCAEQAVTDSQAVGK
ncbi:TPA: hypothetical protein UMT99_000603 [Stenotrophomonas maltophilia]|nr:hypothetical protein [Stenotrophomonas maltophilia]